MCIWEMVRLEILILLYFFLFVFASYFVSNISVYPNAQSTTRKISYKREISPTFYTPGTSINESRYLHKGKPNPRFQRQKF